MNYKDTVNVNMRKIYPKRILLFLIDAFLGIASLYLAFLLRFDGEIPEHEVALFFYLLPLVLVLRSVSHCYFGFYSSLWKYCGLENMLQIIKAVVAGSASILSVAFFYDRATAIPRSIFLIDLVLLMIFVGGSRLAWRLWTERNRDRTIPSKKANMKNILVFGAGATGSIFVNSLWKQFPHYVACGFIDDDPEKLGHKLRGKRVLGNRRDIPELVKAHGIEEIVIASNSITSESLREVVKICNQSGVKHRILASFTDMAMNEVHISRIRNIEISDLLGRSPVSLDVSAIKKMVCGKNILVTGAAGSIGSELCRQLLEFSPASLVMLDKGENYLYELGKSLDCEEKKTKPYFLYGCVTNKDKMESIFLQYQPQLVFHAAAHKHVPLMEANVDEVVKNNVYGTKVIADLCDEFCVEKFVLVSTDKVVNPTSVMGMTKNIVEQYTQHVGRKSETQFMAVRFGNVLGSRGSVVPLFQEQIEKGGPVTVTHPEMTRYFMMIPEAAQLILQAAAIGNGGEIFMLEMGKPVKITDLAKKMIKLAGCEPGKDIEIKFVGVRPGEKLFEELSLKDEEFTGTFHKKIKILASTEFFDPYFESRINQLCQHATSNQDAQLIRKMLRQFVENRNRKFVLVLNNKTAEKAKPISVEMVVPKRDSKKAIIPS